MTASCAAPATSPAPAAAAADEVRRVVLRSDADRREHAEALTLLESAPAQVQLAVRHGARVTLGRAGVAGGQFVMLTRGTVGSGPPAVGLSRGRLELLVDELAQVVPSPPGAWTSDERDRPGWQGVRVPFEDVPLLAGLVRSGDADGLGAALRVGALPALPGWLREAAFGLEASAVVSVRTGAREAVCAHAVLLPSGWCTLDLDAAETVRAVPLPGLRPALLSACTAVAVRTAAVAQDAA